MFSRPLKELLAAALVCLSLAGCAEENRSADPRGGQVAVPGNEGLDAKIAEGESCLQQAFVLFGAPTVHLEAARCAEQAFRSVVEADPSRADVWYQLGFAQEYLDQHEDALLSYKEAEKESHFFEATLARGRLLAKLGRLEEAAEVLRPLNSAEGLHERSKLLAKKGQFTEAAQFLKAAVTKDPTYAEAWLQLARVSYRLGNEHDAQEAETRFEFLEENGLTLDRLQTVVRVTPEDPLAWKTLGVAWLRRGRPRESALAFSKARALAPNDMEAGLLHGNAYMQSGQWASARELFRALSERHPGELQPRLLHAATTVELGERREAIEILERLHGDFPQNQDTLRILIRLHGQEGDLKTAAEYSRKLRAAGGTQ